MADKSQMQSLVGGLQYLANGTRPDICHATNAVAAFVSDPSEKHLIAVKRILRYLQHTPDLGIQFTKGDSKLLGYGDADYAGDTETRKSTTGYVVTLANGPVVWNSKKQTCVALSTAESEYVACSATAREIKYLRAVLKELGVEQKGPTMLYQDNNAAIANARGIDRKGSLRHIDVAHHFTRGCVERGEITVEYKPSTEMVADIMTKALSRDKFVKLRDRMGVT